MRKFFEKLPLIQVRLIILAALCSGSAPLPDTPTTRPANLPAIIEQAMRANEDSLDPIAVSWTRQNSTDAPPAEMAAKLKVGPQFWNAHEYAITWQHGRIYGRSTPIPADRSLNEVSFDGRVWYLANTDKTGRATLSKQINANIIKNNKQIGAGREGTWLGDDYFTLAGLRALSTSKEMALGHADPEAIALINAGGIVTSAEQISRDGQMLTRLAISADNPFRVYADKTDRQTIYRMTGGMTVSGRQSFIARWEASKLLPPKRDYVFYLDASKNYAVLGRQERDGNQLLSDTVNESFRQLPGRAVWLPGKSTTTCYASPNDVTILSDTPLWRQVIELKEITFTPAPPQRFVIDYHAPGTHLIDRTISDTPSDYTIKANSSPTSQPGRPPGYEPLANVQAAPTTVEQHSAVIWIFAIFVALAGAGGMWIYLKSWKAPRGSMDDSARR